MKWIKVSERLPEIDEKVLVNDGSDWYEISWRYNHKKKNLPNPSWYTSCCCNQFSSSDITHWMPLPEPAKDSE